MASLLSLGLAGVRQRGVRLCLGNLGDVLRRSEALRKISNQKKWFFSSFKKKFLVLVQNQVKKSDSQTMEIPEVRVFNTVNSYSPWVAFYSSFCLSYNHGALFEVKLKMLCHKIVKLCISILLWEESAGICRVEVPAISILALHQHLFLLQFKIVVNNGIKAYCIK